MPVSHRRLDSDGTPRGFLLESYQGEIMPGDTLELTPSPAVAEILAAIGLGSTALRLVLPCEGFEPEIDLSSHIVVIPLPGNLARTMRARLELLFDPDRELQWLPPTMREIRYETPLTPEYAVEFVVQMRIDCNVREVLVGADARSELRAGPWISVNWWGHTRKKELRLENLSHG